MRKSLELVELVEEAEARIAPHVRRTYLEDSPAYNEISGAKVFFKCENLQHTGSFKLRGAMNKLLSLTPEQVRHGVVAASTGNHGKAVGYAARQLGMKAKVFVPETADPAKIAAIKAYGVDVTVAGSDCVEAEREAKQFASDTDSIYVSPYNDPLVAAGQGVIGRELCCQLDQIDAVFVALGGGGLISGVGAAVKSVFPQCKIVGCSPENSKVMIDSLQAGQLLDLPSTETLSDATAGGVEQESITFGYCQEWVDQLVTVSEDEILTELNRYIGTHQRLIEGAAAVAIAGLIKNAPSFRGQNVVIILCGANISLEKLQTAVGQASSLS